MNKKEAEKVGYRQEKFFHSTQFPPLEDLLDTESEKMFGTQTLETLRELEHSMNSYIEMPYTLV